MAIRFYAERPPAQLCFPGYKTNPLNGLNLAKNQMLVLDGEMCDVAARTTRGRINCDFREDELRSPFQRDAQRIGSSGLFFRLKDKTQVFPLPMDPTMRNRFTHSIDLANLAESAAIILRLNPFLARAGGLAHDVGHSPFGHAGEAVLDELRRRDLGLYHKHNLIGAYFLMEYYKNPINGERLGATHETIDAVACHLGETKEQEIIPYGALPGEREHPKSLNLAELLKGNVRRLEDYRIFFPSTLEGCLVRMFDRVTSVARDPEDAVQKGMMEWKQIPEIAKKVFSDEDGNVHASSIIKRLMRSIIENSWDPTHHTIYSIKIGDKESAAMNALYDFNMGRIYRHPRMIKEFLHFVPYIIHNLYLDYTLNTHDPQDLPMDQQVAIYRIAYMTDKEAMDEMKRIKENEFEIKPLV